MALIPLISILNKKYSSEATIKYFLVQAMASRLFLFTSIILTVQYSYFVTETNFINSFILCSALLLKIGAAPFHFWLPEVIRGINWKINFIILTWQKLAPIIIIYQIIPNPLYFSCIIILSSVIRGIQGLNQTCFRKIIAYSSINHTSWILARILFSLSLWITYFTVYTVINLRIILLIKNFNIFNITMLRKFFSSNKIKKFIFLLRFLNLGGLPPFLGFLPKWIVILNLTHTNFLFLTALIIIFTLITLYFYLRLTISTFSINSEESLVNFFFNINYFRIIINIFSLIRLAIYSLLTNYL